MAFTLATAAEYLRTAKAPKAFFSFIKQIKKVFTSYQERGNRLVRYLEIVHAYKQGVPVNYIVLKYGCSRNTVLRYARLAGLDRRPKHLDTKTRAAVIAAYKSNMSVANIAERFGVSQAYVSKVATEEGISRYKKRS